MSSESLAISARGVGKRYTLYQRPQDHLKHTLLWRFGRHYGQPFWALRDVSFDIRRGETFGIIGRNGSGKSTLLQILAGILQPSKGEVQVNGRVAALLELGSGFNPDYTGRENIYLNGTILGITPAQMQKQIDQIIAFADIGAFIDQPVKLYSSGMFVRLAFAVATGVDADILLIDEALAVGDIFFRQKCYQRLETLRQKGASVVLVSHAMNEVEQFCERALLLDGGKVQFLGSAVEAVKRYYLFEQAGRQVNLPEAQAEAATGVELAEMQGDFWPGDESWMDLSGAAQVSNGWGRCTRVAVTDRFGRPSAHFTQGSQASIFFEFAVERAIQVPLGGFQLQNEKGVIIHGKTSLEAGPLSPGAAQPGQRVRFRYDVTLEIAPGEYTFEVGFSTIPAEVYEKRWQFDHQHLYSRVTRICTLTGLGPLAVAFRDEPGQTQLLHHGAANLPGNLSVSIV